MFSQIKYIGIQNKFKYVSNTINEKFNTKLPTTISPKQDCATRYNKNGREILEKRN